MARELKRKLDYSDLQVTPDDGRRYELVRGELLVTPSPSPLHQRVSKRLVLALVEYFEGRSIGEVFVAPVDVILTRHDVFVPDLLVVSSPRHVSKRGIEHAPLLVVEILSPSTHKQDRGTKARRYDCAGASRLGRPGPRSRGALALGRRRPPGYTPRHSKVAAPVAGGRSRRARWDVGFCLPQCCS